MGLHNRIQNICLYISAIDDASMILLSLISVRIWSIKLKGYDYDLYQRRSIDKRSESLSFLMMSDEWRCRDVPTTDEVHDIGRTPTPVFTTTNWKQKSFSVTKSKE
jgi:hypothetical protein